VYALENGTQGWYLNDHVLEHGGTRRYADDSGNTDLRPAAKALAERFGVPVVTAQAVQQWAADASRSLFLCDVRTPEEFAAGSLPGAQHTPGGQLMQAGDQYVGVRGARLVLFDNDGVRAPAVASWLRQMGHDASVLEGGLSASGLSLAPAAPRSCSPATLATIDAHALAARLEKNDVALIDLRGSMAFRAGHIAQARWSIRPRLAADVKNETRQLVLVADDAALAAWTASSELANLCPLPLLLQAAWPPGAPPAFRWKPRPRCPRTPTASTTCSSCTTATTATRRPRAATSHGRRASSRSSMRRSAPPSACPRRTPEARGHRTSDPPAC
jgi:rhodanese-related sulfurtransferase